MAASSTGTDLTVHLITLGNSNVGKSSLLLQYAEGRFSPSYITTIGIDVTSKEEDLVLEAGAPAVHTLVKAWDTAGQERFRSISRQYLKKCQGAMLVFDVTDADTFAAVGDWMTQLTAPEVGQKGIPMVLVANKVDLTSKRVVSEEDGRAAAARIGRGIPYIETSAATGTNVREAFMLLATEAAKTRVGRAKAPAGTVTVSAPAAKPQGGGCPC